MKRIFFSVGEPSGDLHGANLIRQLTKRSREVECLGYGGPRMRSAGCKLHEDLTELAVMWITRVIAKLPRFWELVRQAELCFRHDRPDAVVLIDYPGFNWWIARRAKAHGIPVFYYGVPQLWAWASWRVKKMRRLVDYALCKLPFEVDWYRSRGCDATYVGHPFYDELINQKLDEVFLEIQQSQPGKLVTILPGSRTQEVTAHLSTFLNAAKLIHDENPSTRFAIACFNSKQAKIASDAIEGSLLPIEVYVGKTPELIKSADCCIACSGSVSLELLYHQKPTVINYRIGRLAYHVQDRFRRARFITLVNLLATKRIDRQPCENDTEEMVFPETVSFQDESEKIAKQIICWMSNRSARAEIDRQLEELKAKYCHGGASANAADFILQQLTSEEAAMATHHQPVVESETSRHESTHNEAAQHLDAA